MKSSTVGIVSVIAPMAVFSVSEKPVRVEMPTYYVKAWHFDRDALDTPVDVVVIDRQEIENSLAKDVPELLSLEANLLFSNIAGSRNVAMRGFGENSGLRTLILIDGQPLNPADMGRINWEQIPLDTVESIEVLRGGNNVLYGDKALAGVIKIETRRRGGNQLEVNGSLGSDDFSEASLIGSIGDDRWGLRAGVSRLEDGGYRENAKNLSKSFELSGGYTFNLGDDVDFRFAQSDLSLQFPGGLSYREFKDDPRQSLNLGDEGSEVEQTSLVARYVGSRDWGSLELLAGYDENETDWTFGAGSYGENDQSGLSLRPRGRLELEQMAFIGGFDFYYDRLNFNRFVDEARSLPNSEAEIEEYRSSLYGLVEYDLNSSLTVSAGLRHEWVLYEVDYIAYDETRYSPFLETNRGLRPNPNFSLVPVVLEGDSYAEVIREEGTAGEFSLNFRVDEVLSLWAGYDRVYRYPVFDERATYQGFPQAEDANVNLEAEEGDNFEIGFKFIGASHRVYLTGFFLMMENEIIYDPDAVGSNTVGDTDVLVRGLNVNLGAVDRYGVDFSWVYERDEHGFSISVAYTETEMKEGVGKGHSVPLAPEWHTTSQIWWEPADPLRVNLAHRYVGSRYQGGDFTNTQRKLEAHSLVDLGLDLQVSPHAKVYTRISNLFDESFAESAFSGSYYSGRGRFFNSGIQLKF